MNREFERQQAHARVQQRVRYSYVSRLVTDELADLYEPLLRFIIIGCTHVAA